MDIDLYTQQLHDPDNQVRIQAAEALFGVQDERAIQALSAALKDESWAVGVQAALSLCALTYDQLAFDSQISLQLNVLPEDYIIAALIEAISDNAAKCNPKKWRDVKYLGRCLKYFTLYTYSPPWSGVRATSG